MTYFHVFLFWIISSPGRSQSHFLRVELGLDTPDYSSQARIGVDNPTVAALSVYVNDLTSVVNQNADQLKAAGAENVV